MRRVFSLRNLALLLSGSGVFWIDFLSKQWAIRTLPFLTERGDYPFGGVGLFDGAPLLSLSLNLITNRGSAWGLLQEWPQLLLVIRLLILLMVLLFLLLGKIRREWQFPLVLILGGALGNIYDVIQFGAVIDFIHLRLGSWSFPLFNVADSAITLGIGWLLYSSWREKP